MYTTYFQLTILVIASLFIGGVITYILLQSRIKTIKEALSSSNASLKGMWDTNDHWQKKYAALEKNKQLDKSEKTNLQVFAKHTSDNSRELN